MKLSKSNIKLATNFFVGDISEFQKKDKDYQNLFLAYASDINSSSIREAVTLDFLKYKQYSEKHGPDGIDLNTGREKEVKPRFFSDGKKISIGGNFNDMTMELLEKKKNYDVVCSVFTEDRLVIVVEFPMSVIYEILKKPIINAKIGKRVVCYFSHFNFQNSDEVIIHYYDYDFINKTKRLAKKTAAIFESKYVNQLSKQKKLNKKFIG